LKFLEQWEGLLQKIKEKGKQGAPVFPEPDSAREKERNVANVLFVFLFAVIFTSAPRSTHTDTQTHSRTDAPGASEHQKFPFLVFV
jgi:hypothetical protein